LRLIDLATGKDLFSCPGHSSAVRSIVIGPDKKTIASSAREPAIIFWNPETASEKLRLNGEGHFFLIAATQDGRTVFSHDPSRGRVGVWDSVTGNCLRRLTVSPQFGLDDEFALSVSPDRKTLAIACNSWNEVMFLDTTSAERRRVKGADRMQIGTLTFTPDGKTLVITRWEGMVDIWDVHTGVRIRRFLPPGNVKLSGGGRRGSHDAAALSPDGKILAYVRNDGHPGLCESLSETAALPHVAEVQRAFALGVGALAFSPDGRTLAWSDLDDTAIHLLEVASGKERHCFAGHENRWSAIRYAHESHVSALTFSGDGKLLVSGSADSTILVWDWSNAGTKTGQVLSPKNLDAYWNDLASDDAIQAFRAVRSLASSPTETVPYLNQRLRPMEPVEQTRLASLVADLNNDSFAVRQKATAELDKIGELAIPALQKVLSGNPSLEVRRRVEDLLKRHLSPVTITSSERLQTHRALEALELIGNAEALRVLERLGQGTATARLTQSARESLRRCRLLTRGS
jgi:WD40 repeat protein